MNIQNTNFHIGLKNDSKNFTFRIFIFRRGEKNGNRVGKIQTINVVCIACFT